MGYIRQTVLRGAMPALLPAQLRAVDGEERLVYDAGGRKSLAEEWDGRKIGARELRALAAAGLEVLRQCREHLLPAEGVVTDPARVYISGEGGFLFVYETEHTERRRGDLSVLADFLLPRLDRTDRAAVLAGYELYRHAADSAGAAEAFRDLSRCGESYAEERVPVIAASGQAENTETLSADEYRHILDSFFEEPEEPPRRPVRPARRARPARRLRAPKVWQQRILIGVGMVIAAAFVLGMLTNDPSIGAGCALIAGAVGALAWLRRAKE